jgi:hypothetical protein
MSDECPICQQVWPITCDSPFRAMMFHAVGLKAMASKEIVNEVFEMSTNEWKSNEKTDILENQPRVTVQSERNVDVNFGSSDAGVT